MRSSDPRAQRYRRESHREDMRRCMFCGKTRLARGMGTHVRNSDGNGHGPYNTIPSEYDIEECEVVDQGTVNIKSRVTSDSESGKELYVCKHCSFAGKGYRGYKIHAGRNEGENGHPEDSDDVTVNDYVVVPATEDWEPVDQSRMNKALLGGDEVGENVNVQVPLADLYSIRSQLENPAIDIDDTIEVVDEIIGSSRSDTAQQ